MSITKLEDQLLIWTRKYISLFVLALVSFVGIGLRVSLRDNVSGDAYYFLLPWYEQIRAAGGLSALSTQVGNYNLAYQTLIALLTYLPIDPLHGYKLLSVIFDYALAATTAIIAWRLMPSKKAESAILTCSLVILSPLVWLNSSAWAQCDSIYTFFLMAALAFFLWDRYTPTFIMLGFAFAFKLQAVFALPFFLASWFDKRRFSLLNFLWIPGILLLTGLPAIIIGRNPMDIITIYFGQVEEYEMMFLNYPSFWALLDGYCQEKYYSMLHATAIFLTLGVILLWMWVWFRSNQKLEGPHCIYLFFILSYTCVLFLPTMHERYGYLYEVTAIVLAVVDKKTWKLLTVLSGISLITYSQYLFGWRAVSMPALAVANCAIYLMYGQHIVRNLAAKKQLNNCN